MTWSYPDVAVHRLVADAARDAPDVVALRDTTHEVTWARLSGLVDEVARVLVGLEPDRVVVSCRHGLDALVFALATWRIGVLLELVDPTQELGRGGRVRGSTTNRGTRDPESAAGEDPASAALGSDAAAEPVSTGGDPADDSGDAPGGSGDAPGDPGDPGSIDQGSDDAGGQDGGDPSGRDHGTVTVWAQDRAAEVVVRVVDARDRSDRGPAVATIVADVARLLDVGARGGRLGRLLGLGRPRDDRPRPGERTRLSRLASRGGQASLPAVDAHRIALHLATPSGPVLATQAQLVAAAFQARLWIPDMATGAEVVANARGWWRPGGLVLGPVLAALTAGTCQLADAGVLASTMSGATVAFADAATWRDLVSSGRWRRALGRGEVSPLTSLRVAGVVVDDAASRPAGARADGLEPEDVERVRRFTEGARVRHAWQVDQAVGPVLAQPLYGRLPGEPGALPLPDTVLAQRGDLVWCHGPQLASSGQGPRGWVDVTAAGLPVADLLASVPTPAAATDSVRPEGPGTAAVRPRRTAQPTAGHEGGDQPGAEPVAQQPAPDHLTVDQRAADLPTVDHTADEGSRP